MVAKAVLACLLMGMAWPAPATAQGSEGYQFLKAVKERDGDAVNAALNKPGTVIVNTRDITTGETSLHIVTQRRDLTWLRFLLAKGANPNLEDKNGTTALQLAANLGFVEGVEALVGRGAHIDHANSSGETPLISAVHRRDIGMVRMLLENGANPDRNDNSGRSARDYAELMSSNSQMLDEMEKADEKRRAASQNRSYGPN